MKIKTSIACLFLLSTTACSFVPDYFRPKVDTPAQYSVGETAQSSAQIARDWWKTFGSDELNTLMDQALAQNNDIRAAVHRVEQARASLKIAGADLLPEADASASAGRTRNNPANGSGSSTTSLRAGVSISYEVDLFGRNRANVAAAKASLYGTQLDKDALDLIVMGDVARSYFTVLNARERLKIADDNLHNARELMRIVEARFEAGAASKLEISQQRSALSSTEAARASTELSMKNAENALAVLVGLPAQTLTVGGSDLDGLRVPDIATGQPSTLVERRPDIRASEERLIAANADIGVARAAFFPTVAIGGDFSIAASRLANPATTALGLAASLAVPLFEGGRLEGGVERATAVQAELAENYRHTVLTSFQEVEDALAGVKAAKARERALSVAAEEADNAYALSRQLYDSGAVDFQTLLDAQRTQLSAKDTYSQSRNERLSSAVDLYLALGGGWADETRGQATTPLPLTNATQPATTQPTGEVLPSTNKALSPDDKIY